jgi:branched-chain amino acid aminotransferase
MMQIKIIESKTKKEKPDQNKLGFGNYFTDHMFVMDYEEEKGWHEPRIEPYAPLDLEPSAMVFHYGQMVFEGLKAYLSKKGDVLLFRPMRYLERLNRSNNRLCIPHVDIDFILEALKQLIQVEKAWIPSLPGTSLYIRPFIIATDSHVGVRPSLTYKFIIILSPVGSYYQEGINPVRIYIENKYVRAVRGGIGDVKTSGNYAASLKAQVEAKKKGYTQVLWLDGVERKYIEEVGTMNVFFKIGEEIITPELNGSILEGVTRDSVIHLLKDWGYMISERKISIDEVQTAHSNGTLKEAFGTGTAAVISPIEELACNENHMTISNGKIGEVSRKLYDTITDFQNGTLDDKFGWIMKIF